MATRRLHPRQSSGGLRQQISSDQQQPSATSFIGSDHDPADRQQASGGGVPKSASQAIRHHHIWSFVTEQLPIEDTSSPAQIPNPDGLKPISSSSSPSNQGRRHPSLKPWRNPDGLKPTLYRTVGLARSANLRTTISFNATTLAVDRTFDGVDAVPSLREPFSKFLSMSPKFQSSEQINQLCDREYSHLTDASAKRIRVQIAGRILPISNQQETANDV
ncbi:hypothetical protein ACLOJK_004590 [Asimina triloba]